MPTGQSYDSSRGSLSCFSYEGDGEVPISEETSDRLLGIITNLYTDAFHRLPGGDMPDLIELMNHGGICLGLLGPISNIILNTVSFLEPHFKIQENGPRRPSRWSNRQIEDRLQPIVLKSYYGLLKFLTMYFKLLNEEQAGRYLCCARADLSLAVRLVEHDLYVAEPAPPDPRSGRTRWSLMLAAKEVFHPAPDYLAWLMTSWFPQQPLDTLATILPQTRKLTIVEIKTLVEVLRCRTPTTTPPCRPQGPNDYTSRVDLGDGRIACTFVVQQAGDYIASRLQGPQSIQEAMPSSTGGHDSCCAYRLSKDFARCAYVRSLEMFVHGTIHTFYIKALALLPRNIAFRHMRGILVAGHCYGPLDPVSNIILNAIWFDMAFPLPESDRNIEAYDILDTLSILRTEFCSSQGLVALLHAIDGEQTVHETAKFLCYMQCDLSVMLQSRSGNPVNPYAPAAAAAYHPQSCALAEFLISLTPVKLSQLRCLISNANGLLSYESVNQIYEILREEIPATLGVQPPLLCDQAEITLSRIRSVYDGKRNFFRRKLEQLLEQYANYHPNEPIYDLNFICGVERTGHIYEGYHINFMATTGLTSKNTLFFAEFWMGYCDQLKPSFCCPLSLLHVGRCYYGETSATKIVYPDSIGHFAHIISSGGIRDVNDIVDADFIYFDSERDVEFAHVVNDHYASHIYQRPSILSSDKERVASSGVQDLPNYMSYPKCN